MALFAVTGLLSLGAGMGLGALLPVTPKKESKLEGGGHRLQSEDEEQPPVHQKHKERSLPTHGPPPPVGPYPGVLDFDEFDKSLMKMLATEKYSTVRPSVAYDPKYYTPPSTLTQPKQPKVLLSPTPKDQPVVPTPTPTPTLQGGGKNRPAPKQPRPLNTSWF